MQDNSPTTSLLISQLLQCLQKIKQDLPIIYNQKIGFINLSPDLEELKAKLQSEEKTIVALAENIQRFLDSYKTDSDKEALISFSKLFLNVLEGIVHRLSQIESELLPTKAIQELLKNLKINLEKLNSPISLPPITIPPEAFLRREKSAHITQQELFKNNIREKLSLLQQKVSSGFNSKKVFISYAWPIDNAHEEQWTFDFIINLAKDLETAGLRVFLDRIQSNAGSGLLEFMREHIRTADHVIVICDRTMQYKFETDGGSGVVFEYIETMNRWRKDKPPRFVIPLYLTGDGYAPGLVNKFAGVSVYDDGYINILIELISRTYGFGTLYDTWWKQNIESLSVSALPPKPPRETSAPNLAVIPSTALTTQHGIFSSSTPSGSVASAGAPAAAPRKELLVEDVTAKDDVIVLAHDQDRTSGKNIKTDKGAVFVSVGGSATKEQIEGLQGFFVRPPGK